MLELNCLVIAYALIGTLIISSAKKKHKHHNLFYIINTLIIIWETIPFVTPIPSSALRILFDWSPLIFLPLLHQETALIAAAFNLGHYDEHCIRFDKKYFPFVMEMHKNNRADSKLLSEYLHFCYLSFYLLIYGVPFYFYIHHDFMRFYESTFMILFLLFTCYITHGIVPVCGPRNIVEKINDHRSQGVFFRLVHKVLEGGATEGTAFPSGHTGTAVVVMLITGYLHTPLFYFVAPFSVGLILSTIYGRFHYVIDLMVGCIYALIAFFVTILVYHS